jgi:hypothetical protein
VSRQSDAVSGCGWALLNRGRRRRLGTLDSAGLPSPWGSLRPLGARTGIQSRRRGPSGGGRGVLAGLIEPSRHTGAVAEGRSVQEDDGADSHRHTTHLLFGGRTRSPRGCRLCRRDSAAGWIRRGARRQRPSSRPCRGAAPGVRQFPRDSDPDPCASSPRGSRSAGCGRSPGGRTCWRKSWRTPAR